MKYATNTRLKSESGDHGTMGKFVMGMFEAYSGGLAWRGDAHDISCLPPAPDAAPIVYLLQNIWSEAHKRKVYHYTKMRLPDGSWGPLPDGRTNPEIHAANLMGDVAKRMLKQLLGCTALGRAIAPFRKGEKFHAYGPANPGPPTPMQLCALEADQVGLASSQDAVAAFEAEAAGEDIELTELWSA